MDSDAEIQPLTLRGALRSIARAAAATDPAAKLPFEAPSLTALTEQMNPE
jgi:hypothetical protein